MEIKSSQANPSGPSPVERETFLSSLSRHIGFAWIFFLVNILLLSTIAVLTADSVLSFCSYSSREMAIFVTCPSVFGWYEIIVDFLYLIFFWIFWSVFFAFIPEIILIVLYVSGLLSVTKRIKDKLSGVSGNESNTKLCVLHVLRLSLLLFPLIAVTSVFLVDWRVSHFLDEERARVKDEREEKYITIATNNPDFCKDAPNDIYLTTSNTAGNPTLHYPVGHWSGSGVAYLSRENYWNGADDPKMEFHAETYSPGIVSFSSTTAVTFSPNSSLGSISVGQRYDLYVYILNDVAQSTLSGDEKFTDRYTFFGGTFKERFTEVGLTFNVNSSQYINKEECLTVIVK